MSDTPTFSMLVIEHFAIPELDAALTEASWFEQFELPKSKSLRRVVVGDVVYILSNHANEGSKYLFIKLEQGGLLSDAENPGEAFRRICHVSLSHFENCISIPNTWHKYTHNTKLSVYAARQASNTSERIYFDRLSADHIYAFALTVGAVNIDEISVDRKAYKKASDCLVDALIQEEGSTTVHDQVHEFGIVLSEPHIPQSLYGVNIEELRDQKLTEEQRRFVLKGYDGPVRLRGAAGTGKTWAMCVKLLNDAYAKEKAGEKFRFAFITHSWATAKLSTDILRTIDSSYLIGNFKHVSFQVDSIYDLTSKLLKYDFDEIEPLHTDGAEGRKMQNELISSLLDKSLHRPDMADLHKAKLSDGLKKRLMSDSATARNALILEIANEFANVLDAEGIRRDNELAVRYLEGRRESWQMNLPQREDREFLLDLHFDYCSALQEMSVLGLDQMISDLNRHLGSHQWNSTRDRYGFDAVFVDELHLFTRPERMALHNLFRKKSDHLPLFMALDLKQSVKDTFNDGVETESAQAFFRSLKVGASDSIQLTKVFRYTPEISDFIVDLDKRFPAIDLAGEWDQYIGKSQLESGAIPVLHVYKTNLELVKAIFKLAATDARRGNGKKVAVLCINDELFDQYAQTSYNAEQRVNLTSRDQVPDLRYFRRRFVFSQPQYVAGLQFDTVYLIHADRADMKFDESSIGEQRRYISQIYLGASRAEKTLVIASSDERAGPSEVLNAPLASKTLIKA